MDASQQPPAWAPTPYWPHYAGAGAGAHQMGPYGPQGGYAYAHYPTAPPPDGVVPQGAARAAPPQLPGAAVLAEAARGGRGSNVFFKTRVCNKFRQGSCPYSTKCTYAHGQHELRFIPPELLEQLEQQDVGAPGGAPGGAAPRAAPRAAPGDAPARAGAGPAAGSRLKTRLCIQFMQTGACGRGAACSFAHGYEDLRSGSAAAAGGPRAAAPPSPAALAQQRHYAMMHQQHFYQQQSFAMMQQHRHFYAQYYAPPPPPQAEPEPRTPTRARGGGGGSGGNGRAARAAAAAALAGGATTTAPPPRAGSGSASTRSSEELATTPYKGEAREA